jgi:hypothetical protein
MENCWICNEPANSEEHKFKASDLKRTYGKKFQGMYIGEKPIPVNSYKAKELKFPKIICECCNVRRTRPHDDAYDIFTKYFHNNFEELVSSKILNFEAIYGKDWYEQKLNLYRYYAKHAGCKVRTSGLPHDLRDLSEFIRGKDHTEHLALKFELKVVIQLIHYYYNQKHKYGHLFNGHTVNFGWDRNNFSFGGWLSFNWLTVNWVVSKDISEFKKTNFNRRFESLDIIDLDYYNLTALEMDSYDKMITYFDNGALNTLDRRVEHFKRMIG